MSIFGKSYGKKISGRFDSKEGKESTPANRSIKAIDHGIAYVTEDRKHYGLILIDDIKRNITLTQPNKISRNMVVNANQEIVEAERFRSKTEYQNSEYPAENWKSKRRQSAEGCIKQMDFL